MDHTKTIVDLVSIKTAGIIPDERLPKSDGAVRFFHKLSALFDFDQREQIATFANRNGISFPQAVKVLTHRALICQDNAPLLTNHERSGL